MQFNIAGNQFRAEAISYESVLRPSDALKMRRMRNRVKHFMTHNQEHIGIFEQLNWFNKTYWPAVLRKDIIAYLMRRNKKVIGYGIISKRNGRYYVTGAIIDDERGKGYGERLFKFLTRQAHVMFCQKYVYLDVQGANRPARKLYHKIGYRQRTHNKKDIVVMRHPGHAVTIKAQTAGKARKVKVTAK